MKKTIILIPVLLLFLAACNGGSGIDRDYHVGTKGVVMEITLKQRVTQILENSELYSALEIRNKGAYSIDDYFEDKYGYLTINYDNYYISAFDEETGPYGDEPMGPPSPIPGVPYDEILRRFGERLRENPDKALVYPFPILLEGKSIENPIGGQDILEFNFWVNKLQGQREHPETQVIYALCYPYKTIFSKPICIDADPYGMDPRKKVCTSKTETYSGGQGAPVSVVKVEPFMSKRGTVVKPTFRIYLRNTGGGSVLSYDPNDGLDHQRRCHSDNIDSLDWSKVRIKASLSGKELECSPETVLIKLNQESYGTCRMKEEDIYSEEFVQASNYKANLDVELDYIYVSTAVHEIEILRET